MWLNHEGRLTTHKLKTTNKYLTCPLWGKHSRFGSVMACYNRTEQEELPLPTEPESLSSFFPLHFTVLFTNYATRLQAWAVIDQVKWISLTSLFSAQQLQLKREAHTKEEPFKPSGYLDLRISATTSTASYATLLIRVSNAPSLTTYGMSKPKGSSSSRTVRCITTTRLLNQTILTNMAVNFGHHPQSF